MYKIYNLNIKYIKYIYIYITYYARDSNQDLSDDMRAPLFIIRLKPKRYKLFKINLILFFIDKMIDIDRHTDRQTDRQIYRQTVRDRQADIHTYRQTDKQARQRNRQTDSQRDRQRDRQLNRQAYRQAGR